ncbi:hypothetical protein HNQ93_002981 [Hymenobacter luteus]|uniref:CBM11 domain-containing protein n=2 Tax=Hymenobacter TaxID=89966 RepID=A0A7W9T241_9BACT|nr:MULTISPECIES: hypothetical protein [Hymenobacter]MBB4603217.1 hypothetical protein [Hymenobacter latericoloratus]MBB6060115.1 hypothetical protein [Hymenobacter luteus]
MKKFTVLLSLAVLGACSSDEKASTSASDAKTITFNDFESVAGWNVDPALLDRGRAHSGKYAIKVDKDREFSLTFDMALGQATPTKIKTVHLEAYAFLPSDKATGMLGVQVMDDTNTQQLFGDGIRLGEAVKSYGKWVPVSKDITLPENITAAQHLRLSLWRADASDYVLIDDVKLSIKE